MSALWNAVSLLLLVLGATTTSATSANTVVQPFRFSVTDVSSASDPAVVTNEWTLEAAELALSSQPRWLLEVAVATVVSWEAPTPPTGSNATGSAAEAEIPWCPQCAVLVDAAKVVVRALLTEGLLTHAVAQHRLPDDTPLHVALYVVDCSTMEAASHGHFPCGLGASFPSLRLHLREGSDTVVSAMFRGVPDPLGVATFIQAQLPASYHVSKQIVAAAFPPAKGRSMLRPQTRTTASVAPKDLVTFVKAHREVLVVALATTSPCRRCAQWALTVDAAQRILNATGNDNRTVVFFRTLVGDSVWRHRWLPDGTEFPALLFFLPDAMTDGQQQPVPLVFHDHMLVDNVLRAVAYWAGGSMINASATFGMRDASRRVVQTVDARVLGFAGGASPVSVVSTQLSGLKRSAANISQYLSVINGNRREAVEHAVLVPPELDRTPAVEAGLVEEDPRARHLFVVLFVASWTSPHQQVLKEINQLVAMARRYDNTNNAITASFAVVDLHGTDAHPRSAVHDVFLGGDASVTLGEVCLDPPCLLTCVQLTGRRGAKQCGGATGLPFNHVATTLEAGALERSLNLAGDPTSDDELNIKPPDALSRALQANHAVHHADSLRPWFVLDPSADLSIVSSSEGRKTLVSKVLAHRKQLVVLFHYGHATSASDAWYSRRALATFEGVCRWLNVSLGNVSSFTTDGGSDTVCVAVNMHHYPKLSQSIRSTTHRVASDALRQSALAQDPKSPFVAVLSLMTDPVPPGGNVETVLPEALQRRLLLDITPEMLVLHPRTVQRAIHSALFGPSQQQGDDDSVVTTLTANTIKQTIVDPEKGVLVLFSGGSGCPHSAALVPMLQDVANAFVRERREVTIATIDALKELDLAERKAVYGVDRLPSLVWYPKGLGKSTAHSGEVYRGIPQKLQVIEYVNDEMGYAFHEMDWLKDSTVAAVTRKTFEAKVSGPSASNASHTVLLLYRTMQQDVKVAEMLLELQKRIEALPEFKSATPPTATGDQTVDRIEDAEDGVEDPLGHANTAPEDRSDMDAASLRRAGIAAPGGGIEFFKMDARRFERYLTRLGLLNGGDELLRLPTIVFLPRGPMKVQRHVSAVLPSASKDPKTKSRGDSYSILDAFDIVSVARFVLSNVDPEKYKDVTSVLSFSKAEIDAASKASTLGTKGSSEPLAPPSIVKELDINSFRGFVDDVHDAVVFFYATWCKHSKAFEPYFLQVAAHFSSDASIQFGKVNVPHNDETGHGQGILSFPTVKMYFVGSRDKSKMIGSDYPFTPQFLSDPVDPNATQSMIHYLETVRRSSRVAELDHERDVRERSLIELNDTSLDAVAHNATDQFIVEFYAPWCGHCRTVIPELQAVGEHFRKQRRMNPIRPRVSLGRIDATKYRNISAAFNATNFYPTLLLFTNERNAKGTIVRRIHKFADHRLAERIIEFVSARIPKVATDHDGKRRGPNTPSDANPITQQRSQHHGDIVSGQDAALAGVDLSGLDLPRVGNDEDGATVKQTTADKKKAKKPGRKTPKEQLEEMYDTEDDLKEVIRKRNVKRKKSGSTKQIRVIERGRTLSRHVQFLDEKSLRALLDTTTIVAVLNCEANIDDEHLEAWNVVAENLDQLIDKRLVVVGVVEASDATPVLKGMLGEAPSITVFRGLATPQVVKYKMLDPYEDHDEYAKIRFGQGGSGTNATEVVEFVRRQVHDVLMSSVELPSLKVYENVTQNLTARVMVMFYAPWSREAQMVAPSYDALAQQFRHLGNVFITRVDVTKNLKLYERMHRAKLPLFLVYDDVSTAQAAVAEDGQRKIPRRLLHEKPSRQQLGAFLINDETIDHDWAYDWFVPYGDEDAVPANRGEGGAKIPSQHTGNTAFSQSSAVYYPKELTSFDALTAFVNAFAPKRGALILFGTAWCKHCPSALAPFVTGAAKVASEVAVGMFNVSSMEDATRLKKAQDAFGVTSYPSVYLYLGDATPSDDSAVPATKRFEFAEKLRSDSAPLLVQFVANVLVRSGLKGSGPLPAYETQTARQDRLRTMRGTDGYAAPNTESVPPSVPPQVLRADRADAVAELLQRYLEHAPPSTPTTTPQPQRHEALIVALNASWCPKDKCGAPLQNTLAQLVGAIARDESHRDYRVALVDVSTKALKALAHTTLGVASAPSFAVVCNGTVHRPQGIQLHPPSPRKADHHALQVASQLLAFVEEMCFELLPLAQQRRRLQDALEEAEEGEVPEMLYDDIMASSSGDSIFAILRNTSTCDRSPYCKEAMRLMRGLSGTYRNRQLTFASVDLSHDDNKHRLEEAAALANGQIPGGVELMYFPVESPPVVYEGELDRNEIRSFLDDEERRMRDSHRRV